MTTPTKRLLALTCIGACAFGGTRALAQSAPRTTDAALLAKYDVNKNGVIDPDEQARIDQDQRAPATPPATSVSNAAGDEIVSMSPFEVVSDTKGYYASNTMSGTRFNTKLEDLASAVTVVTKEQMSDFAMLDINDVFLYTASTEGTGTYTDYTVDRNGSVSENVSLNPTQANRIRGIASANVSLGNFETMGRTPVDPLMLDAIEISRGPNANVFGLGNPSGTVNQVAAGANLTRDRSQIQFRGDDWGGYRSSIDLNRVIKRGVLSLRVNGAFQHDAYTRKPAGQNTIRYGGMLRFQPFKKTSINASLFYYRSNGNRPNASLPRDNISYWIQNGRPTWDPVTSQIKINGQVVATYTNDTGLPDYFNRSFTGSGRFYAYVGPKGLELLGTGSSTSTTNPGSGSGNVRYMSLSAGAGVAAGRFTGQPLFTTTPSIRDKAVYDWENINLASINRFYDRSLTGMLTIDQNLIETPMHRVDAQLAYMREDSNRYQRVSIGELNANGQSGQLLIDPNERLIDGTANPFFLRPYIGVDQPFTTWQPQKWDTYRGQLAYQLNLTRQNKYLRWLGVHQLSGYDEYKYRVNRRYAYKDGITDAHAWIPAGTPRVNQGAISGGSAAAANITRGYWRYYLGDANGNNVDYAPYDFAYGTYPMLYGNPTSGFIREPVAIGQAATTDRTGGTNNSITIIKTLGAIMQNHFWNDRIVTTFGRRQDRQLVRNGSTPQWLNPDGITFNYDTIDHWAPNYRSNRFGKTEQKGVVLKPFRGWEPINRMADASGIQGLFGQLIRGLSLTYNDSNSFTPQDPRFDLYEHELPNPHGEGKEYGFALNLFDGRLVARFNHWETKQLANRGGDASTIAQRVLRHDVASTAAYLLQTQVSNWVTAQHPDWTTDQIHTEVGPQMGLPWEQQQRLLDLFNSGLIASTNDIIGKGKELEININMSRNWTVGASFTETQSITANVSKEVAQWISERMPIWTTIKDPRGPDHVLGTTDDAPVLWWNTNYGGSQTPAQNYATFIGSPFNVIQQMEGTANPQIRKYGARISTNVKLRGITEQKILRNFEVGGALRWEDKGAIGYYGKQQLPASITDLDISRPIYDKARTYIDLNIRYRTRVWSNKVGASFQLTCRNIQEGGRLQAIGAYPDGTPHTYRIIDPRQFILTATFDM